MFEAVLRPNSKYYNNVIIYLYIYTTFHKTILL